MRFSDLHSSGMQTQDQLPKLNVYSLTLCVTWTRQLQSRAFGTVIRYSVNVNSEPVSSTEFKVDRSVAGTRASTRRPISTKGVQAQASPTIFKLRFVGTPKRHGHHG